MKNQLLNCAMTFMFYVLMSTTVWGQQNEPSKNKINENSIVIKLAADTSHFSIKVSVLKEFSLKLVIFKSATISLLYVILVRFYQVWHQLMHHLLACYAILLHQIVNIILLNVFYIFSLILPIYLAVQCCLY